MATFRKIGDKWRAEVARRGVRKSAMFRLKSEAQTWAASMEADISAQRAGMTVNKTIADVLDRYGKEISPTKRGELWELKRIRVLKGYKIASVRLSELDATHVARWRDERLQDVSGSSVCRDWNLLSHAVEIARKEWKWIHKNPFIGEVTRPKVNPSRDKVYTDDQIGMICHACSIMKNCAIVPCTVLQRVGYAFLFAIETGMRAGEIVSLRRDQVRERYVKLTETKNGDTRDVPLSKKAQDILSLFANSEQVFDLNSRQLDASFRQARNNAGLQGYTFHDTRHTALTRLAKIFTNPMDLAKISGHRSLSILLNVYYNPTAEDLAEKMQSSKITQNPAPSPNVPV